MASKKVAPIDQSQNTFSVEDIAKVVNSDAMRRFLFGEQREFNFTDEPVTIQEFVDNLNSILNKDITDCTLPEIRQQKDFVFSMLVSSDWPDAAYGKLRTALSLMTTREMEWRIKFGVGI